MLKQILTISFIIQTTAPSIAQSFEFIYETPEDEVITDVIQDTSGNYYLIGQIGVFNQFLPNASFDGLIIKLNANGDTLATRRYQAPASSFLRFERVLPYNDTSFIIIGTIRESASSNCRIYYAKNEYQSEYLQ
jgi:hypothetical protein